MSSIKAGMGLGGTIWDDMVRWRRTIWDNLIRQEKGRHGMKAERKRNETKGKEIHT